jgi:Flp pilus assembly protein TadD
MVQMTLQQALELAIQRHRAGALREAEHLYRQILTLHPDNVDALHWLAVLVARTGRADEGWQSTPLRPTAGTIWPSS